MRKVKKRLQKLTNLIDKHVLALLRLDVPLVLAWDERSHVFLIAGIDYADVMGPDEIAFDQPSWLTYDVSDGLPGNRSYSEHYYTFEEAQRAFERMCGQCGQKEARHG
jgi:hypothetical protein